MMYEFMLIIFVSILGYFFDGNYKKTLESNDYLPK